MDGEQAFIREILTRPLDTTLWLVWADWLEECGDPGGEFVRLTVTMLSAKADEEARTRAATAGARSPVPNRVRP